MLPAPLRAIATSGQVWNLIERDVTLRHSRMTRGWNERLQDEKSGLNAEQRSRKNGAYYLPARVDLEIKLTDEQAQGLYAACCEVGDVHGIRRDRAFFRAVFDHCLTPLFATRRSCLQAELSRRDGILRTPGSCSAALDHFARQMDKLRADWNTRLEIEGRDCETRERVAHERAASLPPPQVQYPTAPAIREDHERGTTLTIEQVREIASSFTWKDLESRFKDFQSKPDQNLRVTFIRTDWESGEVSEEWYVSGNTVCQKEFEQLASIASRKLGFRTAKDANECWLNRVREWMQTDGLDKSSAWLPTGTVTERGKSGTTYCFETERIAELSVLFCVDLMARGTAESDVSQPATPLTRQVVGRKQKRSVAFTNLAGSLWKQKKGSNGRVGIPEMEAIGVVLDSQNSLRQQSISKGKLPTN